MHNNVKCSFCGFDASNGLGLQLVVLTSYMDLQDFPSIISSSFLILLNKLTITVEFSIALSGYLHSLNFITICICRWRNSCRGRYWIKNCVSDKFKVNSNVSFAFYLLCWIVYWRGMSILKGSIVSSSECCFLARISKSQLLLVAESTGSFKPFFISYTYFWSEFWESESVISAWQLLFWYV